jgi:hypothetical protein
MEKHPILYISNEQFEIQNFESQKFVSILFAHLVENLFSVILSWLFCFSFEVFFEKGEKRDHLVSGFSWELKLRQEKSNWLARNRRVYSGFEIYCDIIAGRGCSKLTDKVQLSEPEVNFYRAIIWLPVYINKNGRLKWPQSIQIFDFQNFLL